MGLWEDGVCSTLGALTCKVTAMRCVCLWSSPSPAWPTADKCSKQSWAAESTSGTVSCGSGAVVSPLDRCRG